MKYLTGSKQALKQKAGTRMSEPGPVTATNILQQARCHVHSGRFHKLLSALYYEGRCNVLVVVHIICTVVIWGE